MYPPLVVARRSRSRACSGWFCSSWFRSTRSSAVAFGTVDPILCNAVPDLEPARLERRLDEPGPQRLAPGGIYWDVAVSARSSTSSSRWPLCLLIGYPVAYYIARHAGRTKSLLLILLILPVLDQLPDADARLGQPAAAPDGYVQPLPDVHRTCSASPTGLARRERLDGYLRARLRLHPVPDPAAFASLDRIDTQPPGSRT